MRAQGRQCPRSKTKLSREKQGRIEEDVEEWLRIYQNGKYSSVRLPDVAMLHKLALYLDRAILPKNARINLELLELPRICSDYLEFFRITLNLLELARVC